MRPLTNLWGTLLALAVTLVMLAAFLIAGDWGLPLRLESELLDLRFRLRPRHSPDVPIVVVEIDDASIAEIGRWPWSRQLSAGCSWHCHKPIPGDTLRPSRGH